MCGIALVLEASPAAGGSPPAECELCESEGPLARALAPELERRLRQRGPSQSARRLLALDGWSLALHAAVLHLRGPRVAAQPAEDAAGNALCWNGEAFGGLADDQDEERNLRAVLSDSDTEALAARLSRASRELQEGDGRGDPVVQVLRRVRGPFAAVYVHRKARRVYFAHDRFGRRSLLYAVKQQGGGELRDVIAEVFDKSEAERGAACTWKCFTQQELHQLCLSSVAIKNSGGLEFKEVPSTGIFVLDLSSSNQDSTQQPCYRLEFHSHDQLCSLETPRLTRDIFGCGLPITLSSHDSALDAAADALLVSLSNAVGVRVRSIPHQDERSARVGVLFSGGLDSVVLAALTHFHLPLNEPVDLLTVCFDSASGYQSPDRLAAQLSHKELQRLFPARTWNLMCVNVPYDDVVNNERDIAELLAPCDTHMDFNIGAAFWFLSRGKGTLESQEVDGNGGATSSSVDELNAFLRPNAALKASYALDDAISALELFAGGNVDVVSATGMIECPASNCRRKKKKSACRFGVCRVCCLKLQKLLHKLLRFRMDKSSIDEREAAKAVITLLAMGIRDGKEVDALLDILGRDNDGCRAHRPKQLPTEVPCITIDAPVSVAGPNSRGVTYQSSVRVLLVGIGADEQLGGYGRHRTAYRAGGLQNLRDELAMDMARIWKRNLGRDDRCISAHGREARFPFLDENVVETIAQLPLDCICDFELERGEGDKRVLRVAARKLGLESCTRLAKRAIQFGSRIAKHANARAFSSQRQATGDAKFLVE